MLKLLQATYFEQVKCIYIDPPYNTGNDFIYPDNFSETKKAYWEKNGEVKEGVKLTALPESHGRRHSDWLNFMQSRLLLARQMLREDGVIFVSIDDNEVHNLRKLMDEVFGEDNFVGAMQRKQSSGSKNDTDSNKVVVTADQVLIYSKGGFNFLPLLVKPNKSYRQKDEKGRFDIRALEMQGGDDILPLREKMGFSIYYKQKTNDVKIKFDYDLKNKDVYEQPDKILINNDYTCYRPRKRGQQYGIWRWGENTFLERFGEGRVYFDGTRVYLKERQTDFIEKYPESLCLDYLNAQGTNEVKPIFDGQKYFVFPKPIGFIQYLLTISSKNQDFILDFFAGSGTTAHAVMQQNAEDSGNRKYIMVQIPELTDEKSEAYKVGYKTISDITIDRVKRAGAKIRAENPDAKIDTGFRVFKLTQSHFAENLFTPDEDKSDAENIKALEVHLAKAAQKRLFETDEFSHLVTEISLKNGFGLFYQLEAMTDFEHNKIYRLHGNGKSAILCLDDSLHDASVENLKPFNEEQLIVLKSALDTSKKFSLQIEFKDNLWIM